MPQQAYLTDISILLSVSRFSKVISHSLPALGPRHHRHTGLHAILANASYIAHTGQSQGNGTLPLPELKHFHLRPSRRVPTQDAGNVFKHNDEVAGSVSNPRKNTRAKASRESFQCPGRN